MIKRAGARAESVRPWIPDQQHLGRDPLPSTWDRSEVSKREFDTMCPEDDGDPPDDSLADWNRAREGGDGEHWNRIWDRYHYRLLILANVKLGPALRTLVSAEDLVQEVWYRLFKKASKIEYRSRPAFLSFCSLELKRVCDEWTRRRRLDMRSLEDGGDSSSGPDLREAVRAAGPGPFTETGRRDDLRIYVATLESLPEPYRQLIIATDFEGKSCEALAVEMGRVRADSVRQQLKRARDAWGKKLRPFGLVDLDD